MKELPKWFKAKVYEEGAEVTNPYSGESYTLNNLELSMYDFIIGCSLLMDGDMLPSIVQKDMRKGLNWFRSANPEAYQVLLD